MATSCSTRWGLVAAAAMLVIVSVSSADETRIVSRVLFGSCIKQDRSMPILERIIEERPDLFIFLGDNIYADTEDMELMRSKYAKLQADPGFARLRTTCPIMATWDDHDFGVNDGGADYPRRVESQQIFVDFWNDPPDSPRRQRPGVYDAAVWGPAGQRVQVILLDTRYFRSPLATGDPQTGGRYVPTLDPQATMLGEDQWLWLEEQLRVPAELRIISTSIQFLASAAGQETWSNMPLERERLIRLIKNKRAEGVVFISGDRHWAEFSMVDQDVPYPLFDFTSSSLNQLHPRGTPTVNRWRVSTGTFHRENYGMLTIAWDGPAPQLTWDIRDGEGTVRLRHQVRLDELQHSEP